ncbi:MAG: hypothetical protein NW237_17635 [Cyanobacteriota bacterium]|nr:hypothetical protein [Cyanobacteriota bacterium]
MNSKPRLSVQPDQFLTAPALAKSHAHRLALVSGKASGSPIGSFSLSVQAWRIGWQQTQQFFLKLWQKPAHRSQREKNMIKGLLALAGAVLMVDVVLASVL